MIWNIWLDIHIRKEIISISDHKDALITTTYVGHIKMPINNWMWLQNKGSKRNEIATNMIPQINE